LRSSAAAQRDAPRVFGIGPRDGAERLADQQRQAARQFVHAFVRRLVHDAQARPDLLVEVLRQPRAGLQELVLYPVVQFGAQLSECVFVLRLRPALLVDVEHSPLELRAGAQRAEHLVGASEQAVEEMELLIQQLEDAPVAALAVLRKLATRTGNRWP